MKNLFNSSLYICGLYHLLQGKDITLYVQNQGMYVQNQGMYVQNQAFYFRKSSVLRIRDQ